jgi:hypothetical protein
MADSALLPLIVGGGTPGPEEAPPPAPEKPTPSPSPSASSQQPEVEDAELASVADKARASGAG